MLRDLSKWLSLEPRHRVGVRLLQIFIAAALLIRLTTELRYADYFWGPKAVVYGSTNIFFGDWLGSRLDSIFSTSIGTHVLLIALGGAALALILNISTRLSTIAAALLFKIIELRCPVLGDGGDNIAQLALFYLALTLPYGRSPPPNSLLTWLHNLAVGAIAVQTMILYATAGFMKLAGATWRNGRV